jgi:protein-disulfide isomerase
MRKGTIATGVVLALAGGFFLGQQVRRGDAAVREGPGPGAPAGAAHPGASGGAAPWPGPGADSPAPRRGPRLDPAKIYRVPLGDAPWRGARDAKVTIVQWSDFQVPFAGRVAATLKELERAYPGALKIVWKDLLLPYHQHALPAAEAARAAGEQGQFWAMHDRLVQSHGALDRPSLERHARELGLDMTRFKAALDEGRFKRAVQADQILAAKLGARRSPAFFVNGRPLWGDVPLEGFKQLVETEIARADELLGQGVPPARLYEELTKAGVDGAAAGGPRPAPPGAAAGGPRPAPPGAAAGGPPP